MKLCHPPSIGMRRAWETFLLSWKLPMRLSWSLEEQV